MNRTGIGQAAVALALHILLFVSGAQAEWQVTGWTAPHVLSDWGAPAGIFNDRNSGEMLMADTRKHQVVVFDHKGLERFHFTHSIQDARTNTTVLGEPHDLVVTAAGLTYLTDYLSPDVSILNFRGDKIGRLDIAKALGATPGRVRAENLALGPGGTLYVTTSGEAAGILAFDANDRLVAKIGYDLEGYKRPGQPGALDVDYEGNIWIADVQGFPVIKRYSPDGKYMGGFGGRDVAHTDFSFPSAILCADDGTLWVADALRQAVKHFTARGEYIELIGGFGQNPGEMQHPCALAGNGATEIYVCERVGRRIQKFTRAASPAQADRADVSLDVKP
jgi:hypothetical protein